MKRTTSIVLAVVLVLFAVLAVGCNNEKEVDYGSLKIENVNISVGETKELSPSFSVADKAEELSYTFEGDSISVENGKVKGLKEGTVTVTAKSEHFETTFTVTVKGYGTLTIDDIEIVMETSKTATIAPKFSIPENAEELTYTTDDRLNRISIAGNTITATTPGEIVVTAKSDHFETTFKVTVIRRGTLTVPDVTLLLGDTAVAVPKFSIPANAEAITYTVADESIISIDADGNITALAIGETTVTAKTEHFETTFKVTVSNSLTFVVNDVTLQRDESKEVKPKFSVEDKTADVTYTIVGENNGIIKIEGNTITALKNGEVTVKAASEEYETTFTVTVTDKVQYTDANSWNDWNKYTLIAPSSNNYLFKTTIELGGKNADGANLNIDFPEYRFFAAKGATKEDCVWTLNVGNEKKAVCTTGSFKINDENPSKTVEVEILVTDRDAFLFVDGKLVGAVLNINFATNIETVKIIYGGQMWSVKYINASVYDKDSAEYAAVAGRSELSAYTNYTFEEDAKTEYVADADTAGTLVIDDIKATAAEGATANIDAKFSNVAKKEALTYTVIDGPENGIIIEGNTIKAVKDGEYTVKAKSDNFEVTFKVFVTGPKVEFSDTYAIIGGDVTVTPKFEFAGTEEEFIYSIVSGNATVEGNKIKIPADATTGGKVVVKATPVKGEAESLYTAKVFTVTVAKTIECPDAKGWGGWNMSTVTTPSRNNYLFKTILELGEHNNEGAIVNIDFPEFRFVIRQGATAEEVVWTIQVGQTRKVTCAAGSFKINDENPLQKVEVEILVTDRDAFLFVDGELVGIVLNIKFVGAEAGVPLTYGGQQWNVKYIDATVYNKDSDEYKAVADRAIVKAYKDYTVDASSDTQYIGNVDEQSPFTVAKVEVQNGTAKPIVTSFPGVNRDYLLKYEIVEGADVIKVENGKVFGLKEGTAKVRATLGIFTCEFDVTVTAGGDLGDADKNAEYSKNTSRDGQFVYEIGEKTNFLFTTTVKTKGFRNTSLNCGDGSTEWKINEDVAVNGVNHEVAVQFGISKDIYRFMIRADSKADKAHGLFSYCAADYSASNGAYSDTRVMAIGTQDILIGNDDKKVTTETCFDVAILVTDNDAFFFVNGVLVNAITNMGEITETFHFGKDQMDKTTRFTDVKVVGLDDASAVALLNNAQVQELLKDEGETKVYADLDRVKDTTDYGTVKIDNVTMTVGQELTIVPTFSNPALAEEMSYVVYLRKDKDGNLVGEEKVADFKVVSFADGKATGLEEGKVYVLAKSKHFECEFTITVKPSTYKWDNLGGNAWSNFVIDESVREKYLFKTTLTIGENGTDDTDKNGKDNYVDFCTHWLSYSFRIFAKKAEDGKASLDEYTVTPWILSECSANGKDIVVRGSKVYKPGDVIEVEILMTENDMFMFVDGKLSAAILNASLTRNADGTIKDNRKCVFGAARTYAEFNDCEFYQEASSEYKAAVAGVAEFVNANKPAEEGKSVVAVDLDTETPVIQNVETKVCTTF